MRLSLGKKMFLGGVVLVTAPLAILGWYAYSTSASATTTQARAAVTSTADNLAHMVQQFLQEEVKLAKEMAAGNDTVAAASKVTAQGAQAAGPELQSLRAKLSHSIKQLGKEYETIFLADMKGNILVDASGGNYEKAQIADRRYFQNARDGQADAGHVVRSKVTGSLITMFATPVKNKEGQVAGVLAMAMNLGSLSHKVSSNRIGKTGYAWMVNQEGAFIAHPKDEVLLKENITKMEGMGKVTERMLKGQKGLEAYTYKNTDKIAGFAPVPLAGWSLAATQDRDEFMALATSIRNGVIIIIAISLGLAVGLVLLLTRSIVQPINRVVKGLMQAAREVSVASHEVNSSSQSLAEGASQQAASLEETSSSLEELSSMTRQNADNARQADSLTNETTGIVREANRSMEELTSSMGDISEASQEISKIIRTIDEIAFQTNLLALNAAVEAARAGEAGAGFAVVADEVRNLAMRAGEAAKNTASLIEGTVAKIKHGDSLVNQTNDAFVRVAEGTGKVAELVAEIAAASAEQSQGIDQINQAATEMDRVTQTNAANAEEAASASEELNGQAEGLQTFVIDLVRVVGGAADDQDQGRPALKGRAPARLAHKAAPKALPATRVRKDNIKLADDDFGDF